MVYSFHFATIALRLMRRPSTDVLSRKVRTQHEYPAPLRDALEFLAGVAHLHLCDLPEL